MGIFGNAFSGWHLILIVVVILLLFGAAKLPALAKSLGESVRILRKETHTDDKGTAEGTADAATPAAAPTPTDAARTDTAP